MQAAIITGYSDNIAALSVEKVDKPKPVKGAALVKIHYAAINPVDTMVVQGFMKDIWATPLPLTVGYDISGVIEDLDDADKDGEFKIGSEVFAVNWGKHDHCAQPTTAGAFAEYIVIGLDKLTAKPKELSHKMAAASALVGSTAYQIVTDCAQVTKDTKVLVLGGAGAVGGFAIQFCKSKNAVVAATSSPRNNDFVKSLGTDVIINYKEQKWYEAVKDYDVILDLTGEKKALENALENNTIKKTGKFISICNHDVGFDPKSHPTLEYSSFYCLKNEPAHQKLFADGLASGDLKLRLDKEFPFTTEGVREMINYQASGKSQGKITLKIAKD